MKILLLWINSSLKLLLSGFMRWISNELYQKEQPIITFLLFFVEIASKLEKVGPTFKFQSNSILAIRSKKRQETDWTS